MRLWGQFPDSAPTVSVTARLCPHVQLTLMPKLLPLVNCLNKQLLLLGGSVKSKTKLNFSPGLLALFICRLGRTKCEVEIPFEELVFWVLWNSITACPLSPPPHAPRKLSPDLKPGWSSFNTAHSDSLRRTQSLVLLQHMFNQINRSNRGSHVLGMGPCCLGRFPGKEPEHVGLRNTVGTKLILLSLVRC